MFNSPDILYAELSYLVFLFSVCGVGVVVNQAGRCCPVRGLVGWLWGMGLTGVTGLTWAAYPGD